LLIVTYSTIQNAGDVMKKKSMKIKIVEYKSEYKSRYKELNYEWLEKYFEVEENDEKILSFPEEEILHKAGHIFFAVVDGEAIGTCTLMKLDDTRFEISKMCVTNKFQGYGIGEKLLDKVISKAYDLGAQEIMLSTNDKLTAALNLYQKKGFRIVKEKPLDLHGYKRESTTMFFDLDLYRNKNESIKREDED